MQVSTFIQQLFLGQAFTSTNNEYQSRWRRIDYEKYFLFSAFLLVSLITYKTCNRLPLANTPAGNSEILLWLRSKFFNDLAAVSQFAADSESISLCDLENKHVHILVLKKGAIYSRKTFSSSDISL